ncbi:hypothetical protein CK203_097261 [Vitis vinifera]|uniref:DUF4283 domain-containing protein n=1 Tax=Vitis vinifera TaxID=29760 RepID=A0A438DRF8_VITVI|nr:hypothetical protein CK203_097261 [Vitis vinifera]
MSRGGRRRFTVESKAYDLVIDEVGGKLRGCIWERCKGLSSWIRFGDASLSSLLVGVESCCRDRDDSNWSLAWEEENRKYRLERRTNEAGRFILCSVRDLEAKRFCLIFPEGKRLSGGWNTLAEKLREVGVAPFRGVKDPLSLEVLKKEKEPDQRTYADVVNLRLGRLGDKVENHPPALVFLKNWAVHAWLLKGKLDIAVMGGGLLLFEFELMSEAERVLARGKRKVLGSVLMMERWHPEVGCFSNGVFAREVWVRVVGLPLHLWNREVFKLIGDGCGGFIAVDNKTESMAELQWARLLVKSVGRDTPSSVQIADEMGCFSVQLWWESPPWFSQVVPEGSALGKGDAVAVEVAGSGSREECRGGVIVKVGQLMEQRGAGEPPCGSSSKGISGCPYELAGRGPGKEVTDGGRQLQDQQSRGREVSKHGRPITLKGWVMGCEERPFLIKGLIEGCEERADIGFEPVLGGLRENRASPRVEVGGMEIRASMEASGGQVKEDGGIACILGGDWRDSESLMAKARARMSEEALLAEASRYEPVIDVLGGVRVHFSSSSLSGCDRAMVVGVVRDPVVIDEEDGYHAPLRALLTDGRPWEMSTEGGKNRGVRSKESEDLEEEEDQGSGWDDSSLAKFSKSLGFSTVGVEGEVLKLLLRLKSRRDQGKKKGSSGMTRFDREVKKLEWSINYEGESRMKGSDRRNGDRALCLK